MLGVAQSGQRSSLKLLSVLRDEEVIFTARHVANSLVSVDPELAEYPMLRSFVRSALESERAEYLEKTLTPDRRGSGRRAGGSPYRPGAARRPTADRVREALFSSLEVGVRQPGRARRARSVRRFGGDRAGGVVPWCRRGSLLVESDRKAAEVVTAQRPGGRAARRHRAHCGRLEQVAAGQNPAKPYDLLFADPPYKLETA